MGRPLGVFGSRVSSPVTARLGLGDERGFPGSETMQLSIPRPVSPGSEGPVAVRGPWLSELVLATCSAWELHLGCFVKVTGTCSGDLRTFLFGS